MMFNVSQLLKDPVGSIRQYTLNVEDSVLSSEIELRSGGSTTLLRTHHGIWGTINVSVDTPVSCGRCLNIYSVCLELDIEEEFFSKSDVDEYDEFAETAIGDDNILDLSEIIRQYTIAGLPMKPLCELDCMGLCQWCGENLNKVDCTCDQRNIDPRWANLLHLAQD